MNFNYGYNYDLNSAKVEKKTQEEEKKKEELKEEEKETKAFVVPESEAVTASANDVLASINKGVVKGANVEGGKGAQGISDEEGGIIEFLMNLFNALVSLWNDYIGNQTNMSELEKIRDLCFINEDYINKINNDINYNLLPDSIKESLDQYKDEVGAELSELGLYDPIYAEEIAHFESDLHELQAAPYNADELEICMNDLESILNNPNYAQLNQDVQDELHEAYTELVAQELELNGINPKPPIGIAVMEYEEAKFRFYTTTEQYIEDPNRELRGVINKFIEMTNCIGYDQLPESMRNRFEREFCQFSILFDSRESQFNANAPGFGIQEDALVINHCEQDPDSLSVYGFAFDNLSMRDKLKYFRSKVSKNQTTIEAMQKIISSNIPFPQLRARAQTQLNRFTELLAASREYLSQSRIPLITPSTVQQTQQEQI